MKTKPFAMRAALVAVFAGLATVAWAALADVDPYDQSGVPLEKQPTDPALNKIVLVAGHTSHGKREHEFFAGCAVLMKLLQETPGVYPVMARDDWPKDPEATFKDARAVVLYMDGGDHHPAIKSREHQDAIQKLIDAKVGFVNLHYGVEYPKAAADPVLHWLGGYYETGYSINPTWTADYKVLPEHPITRGVKPFTIKDEWYYNIRFDPEQKGVTPILKATPPDNTRGTPAAKEHPGREETMAWAFDRADGGRSFGFTGGHYHDNWGDENFRRLVVNAILWSAKIDVPKDGAKVDLDPAELNKNLDKK
jgi:type 1 glutamine amidotransferase